MAGLWDVVAALPRGIDTMVGERGGRFSGGQRQRMSLARALVRRPVLLLLDEITAALDEETERAVCATLRHLAGEMTVIAVSHQAEMARVADRVFRLHDGRFVSGRQ
jgi:ATP-binding cassette subfamily C protein